MKLNVEKKKKHIRRLKNRVKKKNVSLVQMKN